MCACMQQYHRTRWRVLQGRFETLEVEADSARIIIRIFERGDTDILENSIMNDYADLSATRKTYMKTGLLHVGLHKKTCFGPLKL